jgi:hypothetical protein
MSLTEYEQKRRETIKQNTEKLKQLGLLSDSTNKRQVV